MKVVCLRNYLNCEKGIKGKAREKDTLRLQVCSKQSGDAQGHLRNGYIWSTFSTYESNLSVLLVLRDQFYKNFFSRSLHMFVMR